MKPASSSLNPYAASYVPLSRRGADHTTSSFEKERPLKDLKSSEVPMPEAPLRSYATVASASTSRHSADFMDKHNLDEGFQMNLDYLQMMFPGLSYQSLAAVYLENKEDMEATVEMLAQLEIRCRYRKKNGCLAIELAANLICLCWGENKPGLANMQQGWDQTFWSLKLTVCDQIAYFTSHTQSYLDEPLENLPETLDIGDITDVSAESKLKNIKDEPVASSSGNSYSIA